MTSPAVTAIVEALRRFEKRDTDAIAGSFAADGVFIDPHYPPPVGPAVAGREAIRAATAGVFGMIQQPGFTVRHALWSDNPSVASVEVDTHHLMADGTTAAFPQVFVGEIDPPASSSACRATCPTRRQWVSGSSRPTNPVDNGLQPPQTPGRSSLRAHHAWPIWRTQCVGWSTCGTSPVPICGG